MVRSACSGHSGRLVEHERALRALAAAGSQRERGARVSTRRCADKEARGTRMHAARRRAAVHYTTSCRQRLAAQLLGEGLEGEQQVLEHAQHARPARPARRHTRAARSPRRAARTARLEQQEQLEKQPSLCRSSMPSLHTENPVAMLASVRASTAGARAWRERPTRRAPAAAHHAARSRQQSQRPAGAGGATPGDTAFSG